jgi:hypothetical protein
MICYTYLVFYIYLLRLSDYISNVLMGIYCFLFTFMDIIIIIDLLLTYRTHVDFDNIINNYGYRYYNNNIYI